MMPQIFANFRMEVFTLLYLWSKDTWQLQIQSFEKLFSSPNASLLSLFCHRQPSQVFLVNFTSFVVMHLLEGRDLGHSMIYYAGELEKKTQKKKKSPAPGGIEILNLMFKRRVLDHCATTVAQIQRFICVSFAGGDCFNLTMTGRKISILIFSSLILASICSSGALDHGNKARFEGYHLKFKTKNSKFPVDIKD